MGKLCVSAYGGQRGRAPVQQPGHRGVLAARDLVVTPAVRPHVVQRALGTVQVGLGVLAHHLTQLRLSSHPYAHLAAQYGDLRVQLRHLHGALGGVLARQYHHVLPLVRCVGGALRGVGGVQLRFTPRRSSHRLARGLHAGVQLQHQPLHDAAQQDQAQLLVADGRLAGGGDH